MGFARWFSAAGVALALTVSTAAHAGPYSALYVFGDSLSDNGNLAEAFYRRNFPNPPSYHDSFTNGPVAAEVLAGRLGLSLTPSLFLTGFQDAFGLFGGLSYVAGTNYAVAGATAAAAPTFGGIPSANLPQQVAAYFTNASSHGIADPNALYFVLSGGNDVRQAALNNLGTTGITAGVSNEVSAIQLLINEGARSVLVVNVPNVGVIPEFAQDHPTQAAAATSLSQQFDASLASGLSGLTRPTGTIVNLFDLYAFNSAVITNAASYGITDTVDRCFTNTPLTPLATSACGVNGANIGTYFYWDAIHPTGKVQALAGNALAAALGVPEPSTTLLLGAGVIALVYRGRRRKAA